MYNMKLKDIPVSPAYLVCHDLYDNGAMDVYTCSDLASAQLLATKRQDYCDSMGSDGVCWKAYTKLPRVRVYSFHGALAAA